MCKLSVVIATLGGSSLVYTIESLNSGKLVPDEILICIPVEDSFKVESLNYKNVRVISTNCRGQVSQRLEGFKCAVGDFIFQTDDDIIFDRLCLYHLMNAIKDIDKKSSISPDFRFIETNQSIYFQKSGNSLIRSLYYWLINGKDGFREGSITLAGTECGIIPKKNDFGLKNTDWVPGGGVLHHKENLVFENYYPFHGKAYCEDLFHSYYLKSKGVKLYVFSGVLTWINNDILPNKLGPKIFFKNLYDDFKKRKAFVSLAGKSKLRLYLYYFIKVFYYIGSRS